jgi:hypothetical protein
MGKNKTFAEDKSDGKTSVLLHLTQSKKVF